MLRRLPLLPAAVKTNQQVVVHFKKKMRILELSPTDSDVDLDSLDFEIPWLPIIPSASNANMANMETIEALKLYVEESFSVNSSYQETSIEEKPHICDICNKAVRSKCALIAHKGVHKDERPYGCDICSKRFKLKCNLKIHKDTNHANRELHYCQYCGKSYAKIGDLEVPHISI